MKTQEEIEQLAEQLYPKPFNPDSILQLKGYREAYTKGYTQCQEDMANKKYTEEDVINIVNKSRETGLTAEYLMLSLNKQD